MKTSEVPLDLLFKPAVRSAYAYKIYTSATSFGDGQTNTAVILRCSPSWASLEG